MRAFSSCRHKGSTVVAHSLVDLWHVESSRVRDGTCVPCIGRQILTYYTTREVLYSLCLILYLINLVHNF